MHFFNPPAVARLVEVVRGVETSRETLDEARAMAYENMGQAAMAAADRKKAAGLKAARAARPGAGGGL